MSTSHEDTLANSSAETSPSKSPSTCSVDTYLFASGDDEFYHFIAPSLPWSNTTTFVPNLIPSKICPGCSNPGEFLTFQVSRNGNRRIIIHAGLFLHDDEHGPALDVAQTFQQRARYTASVYRALFITGLNNLQEAREIAEQTNLVLEEKARLHERLAKLQEAADQVKTALTGVEASFKSARMLSLSIYMLFGIAINLVVLGQYGAHLGVWSVRPNSFCFTILPVLAWLLCVASWNLLESKWYHKRAVEEVAKGKIDKERAAQRRERDAERGH